MTTAGPFSSLVGDSLRRHGPAALAKLLGTTARTVERWADGTRTPNEATQTRVLGILAAPEAKGGSPPKPAAADDDPRKVAAETVRVLQLELARLATDPHATSRERASVASSLTSATKLHARLSGALEITPGQLLRLPVLQQIKNAIIEAARPWPDALLAIADALDGWADEEERR